MSKMLVVYNTCGISGRENSEYYRRAISSIINQSFEDFNIVVSDCLCNHATRGRLISYFGNIINYNLIDDRVPVNISFNASVLKAIEHLGEYECYLFVDSGINFESDNLVLQKLYDLYKSGPYSIVHGRAMSDTGFQSFSGLPHHENDYLSYREYFKEHGPYIVPVGMAVNTHVQLHGKELYKAYKKLIPDIFAGQCTESVMTFLAAAIKTNTVISHDTEIEHITGLDIPSIGFSPNAWEYSGGKKWDHLINTNESILDIIGRGTEYGMGYAEGHLDGEGKVQHNPDCFDENGFAKDDRLKDYIKRNMFLSQDQFNYEQMSSQWI